MSEHIPSKKEVEALKAARDHLNVLAFGGFEREGVIPRHYKRTWEKTIEVISQLQSAIDGLAPETPQPASKTRVRLLVDIHDCGQDHHPPGYYGRKGEVLVVREAGNIGVSHEHITDRHFYLKPGEYEFVGSDETCAVPDAGKTKLAITMLERFRDGRLMTAQGTHESLLGPRDQLLQEADWFDHAAKVLRGALETASETPQPESNIRVVPTLEGRLYTDTDNRGFAGRWVRRAEVDALLDEIERLKAQLPHETPVHLGRAEEERKCLIAYHEFHGSQVPDPIGESHRYRAQQLRAAQETGASLVDRTAKHWMDLQLDFPIAWEGGIDAAMKAACDEIRRLHGSQETPARQPDGYAYRYGDGFIRFSGGKRVNGGDPVEAIPYWLGRAEQPIDANGNALKASETPEQRRAAIDAVALSDAHRMYEAHHGRPFSEDES